MDESVAAIEKSNTMTGSPVYLARSYLEDPSHWIPNIIWRIPRTVSELGVVFVIGAPRSGTTLLQRILASHDSFFSIDGETGLFSYQNIFGSKRKHFGLTREDISQLFQDSKDIVDFFEKGVRKLSEMNGSKIFIEKTPQHITQLPFLLKHFPNAKFVHIVRDGRDCFCSAKEHPHIPQNKSVRKFARYWKKCVDYPLKTKSARKLLTIKYEEFCLKTVEQLRIITNFLGCSFQNKQLDPQVYGNDHRANIDQYRRLKSEVAPVSVGRWVKEMDRIEKQVFIQIAGKELNAYGYQ